MRVSPDILGITPYSPGKPIEELERELGISSAVKLASNENPLGPSPKALNAVGDVLQGLHRYPEGSGMMLRRAIAERVKLDPSGVVLGNGSNEIIELLVRAFLEPGDEAIMADLTFLVYQLVVQVAHGVPVSVPLRKGQHDLDAMASCFTEKTRLVFVCNPNNPTGTVVDRQSVEAFLAQVPEDVIVVFDEAYYEYMTDEAFPDAVQYVREGKNVVVLRTFSKIYGLAGLRIGYGLMSAEIANILSRVRQPFNTNSPAQAAALAALSDDAHVKKSRETNEIGKEMLTKAFDHLGLKYLPTQANFIYVDMRRDGREVYEGLLKQGVIVRHIEGTHLRVTIGIPEENEKFLQALRQWMGR